MNSEAEPDRPSDAESIVRLRGEGPRVVRLSRKAIGIASAAALTLVGGALIYALQPVSEAGPDELFGTETVAVADGLASGPSDYSQGPRGAHFNLFTMDLELGKTSITAGDVRQVTSNAAADVLPVFSPDGKKLMWTSARGKGKTSQLWIADWLRVAEAEGR